MPHPHNGNNNSSSKTCGEEKRRKCSDFRKNFVKHETLSLGLLSQICKIGQSGPTPEEKWDPAESHLPALTSSPPHAPMGNHEDPTELFAKNLR